MLEEFKKYFEENTDKKHNCRWMVKRNPELWKYVLSKTSFLPETAVPKQRCWHIEHNIFSIPLCPVTGKEVMWFENRYQTYFDLKAKSNCSENRKKIINTYKQNSGFDGHWSNNPITIEKKRATRKLYKRPYKPFTRSDSWHEKIQATWKAKLGDREITDFKKYRRKVDTLTNATYRKQKHLIKDSHLPRGREYHLDHVFSIFDGFMTGVLPAIIAHWSNLQMLTVHGNVSKHIKSHKTLDDLFNDYFSINLYKDQSQAASL